MTKLCPICHLTKPLIAFYKGRNSYGRSYMCIACCSHKSKEYRKKNMCILARKSKSYRRINKSKLAKQAKKYYLKNAARIKQRMAIYYKRNADKIKAKVTNYRLCHLAQERLNNKKWARNNIKRANVTKKRWEQNNPEKVKVHRQQMNARIMTNPKLNLDRRMRCGIYSALKAVKVGRHWETLVGYTLADLKQDFESKYYDGMSWNSFIKGNIDIHHIKPRHTFKYKTAEDPEFKACWALSNLQPLWRKDHIELHRGKKTLKEILAGEGI